MTAKARVRALAVMTVNGRIQVLGRDEGGDVVAGIPPLAIQQAGGYHPVQ